MSDSAIPLLPLRGAASGSARRLRDADPIADLFFGTSVMVALEVMRELGLSRVRVLGDSGEVLGVLALRELTEATAGLAADPLRRVLGGPVGALLPTAPLRGAGR